MMKSATSILVVIGVILVGAEAILPRGTAFVERPRKPKATPEPMLRCTQEQIDRIFSSEEQCTIECYAYDYGLSMVADRMLEGATCDNGASGQDWSAIEAELIREYSCKIESSNAETMLCFEAAMAVEITNYVGAACIPDFDSLGMYTDPTSVSVGVLGCGSTFQDPTSGLPSATMRGQDLRETSAKLDLECVPAGVQSVCSGHVWRSPVAVNGVCVAVCASSYCSSDFTFNYCLAQTTNIGLTHSQCTADTIVRTQCFSG